jgi:hypothetical protein
MSLFHGSSGLYTLEDVRSRYVSLMQVRSVYVILVQFRPG